MPPRLHVPLALSATADFALPAGAARHVQVLRLQPGDPLVLFDGRGGEWHASVSQMGRKDVTVSIASHDPVERELARAITLAPGVPTNDRMDTLVEKATELGAAAIHPLQTERSVLRLSGERADRRREHWQGVALAAAEQSGRTRVPALGPMRSVAEALRAFGPPDGTARWLLAFGDTVPLDEAAAALAPTQGVVVLSGPEGGLSPAEEALAAQAGFWRVGLGARTLRADTAPLAVLAHLAARERR